MCTQNQALVILKEAFAAGKSIFQDKLNTGYLFGSYARGDYDDESDVDIVLFVNLSQLEISDYGKAIAKISSELSLKYDVTVSILVKPYEYLIKYSELIPLYKNITKEGLKYAG